MNQNKPKIGITLGDVAGIGPEVAVKAFLEPSIEERAIPILIGEFSTVQHYVNHLIPGRKIKVLADPGQAASDSRLIQMFDL